ncbi:MAG: hypothetical protein J5850_02180, partial [Clostridia bacterium]|nr:hypothetical protein [Clostridia bacterium]
VDYSDGAFVCRIDGEKVFAFSDGRFPSGLVGVRSYDKSFAVADLTLRPLNDSEREAISDCLSYGGMTFDISAVTAFETVQVSFPRVPGATFYRIDYGTASGFYTNTVTDIIFNNYKGGGIFSFDKTAFTFTGADCYLKMTAWAGKRLIASSNEIHVDMNVENNAR